MFAYYLRPAMLLTFALVANVAAAQSGPLSPVGSRPFPASALQIAAQKAASSRAGGVSRPTAAQDESGRLHIEAHARERIVRLFPLTVASIGQQSGLQKDSGSSQPPPVRLVTTRMAPLSTGVPAIRQTRSADTLTAATVPVLRPVPAITSPDRTIPAPHVVPVEDIARSGRDQPLTAAEPQSPVRALEESIAAGIYQSLPPVVAFRETRPFIGMQDLRAAAFEKPDAGVTESTPSVPEHRAEPSHTASTTASSAVTESTRAVDRSALAAQPVDVPPKAVAAELAALLEHRKPLMPETKAEPLMLTGPLRATEAAASTSPKSRHSSAAVVKLASRQVQPADETEEVLLAVPPLPPASTPKSPAADASSLEGLEIFNPLYAVTLGNANMHARYAPDDLPENEARQHLGYQEPQYQWSGGHSMYSPNRNTYPICYRPLYFEDPNLERCGQTKGCLTELCSIAYFAGRIPALPYLMTAQSPHRCVRALPDCPSCNRFGHDAYFPKPDEVNLAGVAVQSAATVGLVFLLP